MCTVFGLYEFFFGPTLEDLQPAPVVVEQDPIRDGHRPPHKPGQVHSHAHHHYNQYHESAVSAVPSDHI